MDLTVTVNKNGDTKFITDDKDIKKIIKSSLKRLKKANFDEYEAETALASLIPFIMVPESLDDKNLSIDYFQEGISGKELKKVMKNIVENYIARVSFG